MQQRATPRGTNRPTGNVQSGKRNAQLATGTKLTVGGGGAICCRCFFFFFERLADRWCVGVDGAGSLDVAARLVFGVQYEPQLRHLIEHLLTRLGMLTYYWPCSQLMQQLPPSPVAPLQQLPLSCSRTRSLTLSLPLSLALFVYETLPGPVCLLRLRRCQKSVVTSQ